MKGVQVTRRGKNLITRPRSHQHARQRHKRLRNEACTQDRHASEHVMNHNAESFWGIKEIHNYSEEKELANICCTAQFNKTEATMDHHVGQQFPKDLPSRASISEVLSTKKRRIHILYIHILQCKILL